MNDQRLQEQLQRLYGSHGTAPALPTRAAVLELKQPADWNALGAVWRAVQSELGLPAPGIAVSGTAGFQLWFALAEEGMAGPAAELLQALCRVYLPALRLARLGLWTATMEGRVAPALPPQQLAAEQWSAFVAPDLAPVFSEEPWLDTEPGAEAQADVLSRLACTGRAQLAAALLQLNGAPALTTSAAPTAPAAAEASHAAPDTDPRRFLLRVMNDESVTMALRIEAAKALLSVPTSAWSASGTELKSG